MEFCRAANVRWSAGADGLSVTRSRQRRAAISAVRTAGDKSTGVVSTPTGAVGDWYEQLGRTLLHAIRNSYSAEQLDQALLSIPTPQPVVEENRSEILDVIGYEGDAAPTLSWRQAAECFDPLRQTSFWWTNRSDGYPLYTHVHSGNFTGQLFTMLFDPAGGARPGRHGLYPPMFD